MGSILKIKNLLVIIALVLYTSCSDDDENKTENPDPRFETGVFTDNRDGNVYNWVKIGDQVWMTENLRFKADSGCWAYNNDNNLVQKYGYLYNWEAASDTNTVPEGWHLPSKYEFEVLIDTLANLGFSIDTTFVALAKSMVSAETWMPSNNLGCPGGFDYPEFRNKSNFSAVAGGYMSADSIYAGEGYFANWWTVKSRGSSAYFYRISNARTDIYVDKALKDTGFSIRCIKDKETN